MWAGGQCNLASLFFIEDSSSGEWKSEGTNEWRKMEEIVHSLEENEQESISAPRMIPSTVSDIDRKMRYVQRIRTESSYPAFRMFVNIIAYLFYIVGALSIIAGLLNLIGVPLTGITMMILGTLIIATGKVQMEACMILADMADSINDLNCRYD